MVCSWCYGLLILVEENLNFWERYVRCWHGMAWMTPLQPSMRTNDCWIFQLATSMALIKVVELVRFSPDGCVQESIMAMCEFDIVQGDCLSGLNVGRCRGGEAFDEENILTQLGGDWQIYPKLRLLKKSIKLSRSPCCSKDDSESGLQVKKTMKLWSPCRSTCRLTRCF